MYVAIQYMILDLVMRDQNAEYKILRNVDLWSYLWIADAPHFEALFSIPIISNVLITRSPVNDLFLERTKMLFHGFLNHLLHSVFKVIMSTQPTLPTYSSLKPLNPVLLPVLLI